MLLELPLDIQQKALSHLTATDALALRLVNQGCRDLATTCIKRLALSSVSHLAEIDDAFPSVTQLKLHPRNAQEVVHMSLAFETGSYGFPRTPTKLPRALTRLEIDTGQITFSTLPCYQVANAVENCPALEEVHLSAYVIEMTPDDDFLRKVVSLKTIQQGNPPYPPACFLASGLCLPDQLQRCTRLRELVTYTRSNEDTWYLVESLDRHPTLESLELFVPCLDYFGMAIKAIGAEFPKVQELALEDQQQKNSIFPFDLQAFPELKDLVVSLSSQGYARASVEHPHSNLPKLETAFLGDVVDLTPLRWADKLVTLSLSYSAEYVSEPLPDLATTFAALPLIPNLRTLEISDGEIEASVIVACPKLENVVLSNTIDIFTAAPGDYIADLVQSRTLNSIWVGTEGMRLLFPTETFEFAVGWIGQICLKGWTGRVCHAVLRGDTLTEGCHALLRDGVLREDLGLELVRKQPANQPTSTVAP